MTDLATLFYSFDGRIGRQSFWLGFLSIFAVFSGLPFVYSQHHWLHLPVAIVGLVSYASLFAIAAKRYHDLDKSGWNSSMFLIPIFGWLYVLLECGLFKGGAMKNQYGEPLHGPLANRHRSEDRRDDVRE